MDGHLNRGAVVAQGSDDVFEPPVTPEPFLVCGSGNHLSVAAVTSLLSTRDCSSSEALIRCSRGQKARDHFRSSGYGTGSGESSGTSISQTSLHESFSAETSACPQNAETKNVNTATSECKENDFKPRKPIPYACPSTTIENSNMNPRCNKPILAAASLSVMADKSMIAPGLLSSKASTEVPTAYKEIVTNSNKQQSSVLETGSSQRLSKSNQQSSNPHQINNTSAIQETNDMARVHREHEQQQQQQQPTFCRNSPTVGDSTCLQLNLQPHLAGSDITKGGQLHLITSTKDKSCVPPSLKTKRPLLRQNVTQCQDFETGIGGCSDEGLDDRKPVVRNDDQSSSIQVTTVPLGIMNPAGSEHIPNTNDLSIFGESFYLDSSQTSSLEYQFDSVLWKVLEKSARCTDTDCSNPDCVQIRSYMAALQDVRKRLPTLNETDINFLQTLAEHVFHQCFHPRCPFPWCGASLDSDQRPGFSSREDLLLIMKQRLENYAEYCRLSNCSVKDYVTMNSSLTCNSMPVEGQDWVRLCMLGDSRKTILAFPLNYNSFSDLKYWVIKKISTTSDQNRWNLYTRLREVKHGSIASVLWVTSFENHLLVCSQFENLSLHDCLGGLPCQQLGFAAILSIMRQLLSATSHLQDLGIAYLYWICKNILVANGSGAEFCVKICNFSCSAMLDSYDGGMLYLALPPSIITPELREDDKVELASDVWGLGCLLNELVTGKMVWHEYRHLPDLNMNEMLGANPVHPMPTLYPELLPLFRACWETDWKCRKSIHDLQPLLVQADRDNLLNLGPVRH